MKKSMAFLMAAMTAVSLAGCAGGTPADKPAEGSTAASQSADKEQESGQKVYPKGTITIYGTGSPQYRQQYFETWLENHRDIAPEVSVECVQTESMADSREKMCIRDSINTSHNYYYLSFEQEQQPESGGFLFYTDLVNAEEKTWEFHSVIIPQIGSGFICFPKHGLLACLLYTSRCV